MPSLMSLKSIRIYVQNKGGRKETQQMLSSPLRQYRGLVSDVRDLTPPRAHAHPACDAMGTIAKVRRVTAGPWASWGEGQETSFQSTLRLSRRQVFIRITAPYLPSLCDRRCHMLFYLLFATRNAFINRYQNRGF